MFILFTFRIMFKCPFGFGLLFVNNLLHVWYIISIFFLSSFLLVCCLLGVRIPIGLWYLPPFLWVVSLFIRKLVPFFFLFSFSLFLSFMGLMTSSYFCLLMEPSALLAVLHVYSLHWLFIALPIYGALKIFCKATNVVAWIPQIRFFLLGPSVLQS